MQLSAGVSSVCSVIGVVALVSAAALWPAGEAARSTWPLQTYELETEAEQRLSSCPAGWRHDGDQCLMYVPAAISWSDAQRHCQDQVAGATLASVSGPLQMSRLLLRARRAGQDRVWIGLGGWTETSRTVWRWADGSPLSFQAWEEGTAPEAADHQLAEAGEADTADQPPQYCAAFSSRSQSWSPVPCETRLVFFCGYLLANKAD